jgi:hypothetical protein
VDVRNSKKVNCEEFEHCEDRKHRNSKKVNCEECEHREDRKHSDHRDYGCELTVYTRYTSLTWDVCDSDKHSGVFELISSWMDA